MLAIMKISQKVNTDIGLMSCVHALKKACNWSMGKFYQIWNIAFLQQKASMYTKWFHYIFSEFIGCNEWDLLGK